MSDDFMDRAVVTIATQAGEQDINAFISGLPIEKVAPAVLTIRTARLALSRVELLLETRLIQGGVTFWQDPATGDEYDVRGEGRWEYPDVPGLHDLLTRSGMRTDDVERCFKTTTEARTIEINRLLDVYPSLRDEVETFRIRRHGPKHLTKREPRR